MSLEQAKQARKANRGRCQVSVASKEGAKGHVSRASEARGGHIGGALGVSAVLLCIYRILFFEMLAKRFLAFG